MPLPSLLKSLPLVWGKLGKVRGPEKNNFIFIVVTTTGEREIAETYLCAARYRSVQRHYFLCIITCALFPYIYGLHCTATGQ